MKTQTRHKVKTKKAIQIKNLIGTNNAESASNAIDRICIFMQ
jgi:hypothetical protein